MLKKIKNQFGFTLIELLAVIVILAIIALIATPIILNVISDVRYESYKRSAEFYTSALRNSLALEDLKVENKNITIKSSPENVEIKQYALPGTIVDCTKGTPTQNQTCINWEY